MRYAIVLSADGASLRGVISHASSVLGYETFATNLTGAGSDNNEVTDIFVRPTFRPEITNVRGGPWITGQTSTFTLSGSFSSNSVAVVSGNGVLSAVLSAVTANSLTLDITTTTNATPGVRKVWITNPQPQLGTGPTVGAAAEVELNLQL